MAKIWHYPKWRRVALQLVMWGVLGATLGMAALVSAHRQAQAFAAAVPFGPIAVQVPAGWKVNSRSGSESLQVLGAIETNEKSRIKAPRQIYYFLKTLTPPATVQDFLMQPDIGLVPNTDATAGDDEDHSVQIAGYDGVVYVQSSIRTIAITVIIPTTVYIAGTTLPDGTAIGVKYVCDGPPKPSDLQDFAQILDRISLRDK